MSDRGRRVAVAVLFFALLPVLAGIVGGGLWGVRYVLDQRAAAEQREDARRARLEAVHNDQKSIRSGGAFMTRSLQEQVFVDVVIREIEAYRRCVTVEVVSSLDEAGP